VNNGLCCQTNLSLIKLYELLNQNVSHYQVMLEHKIQRKPSPQTQEKAMKLAKSIQRPAQTKEQTKLIAQGIQQGIDL
jgi:hypothetical protein